MNTFIDLIYFIKLTICSTILSGKLLNDDKHIFFRNKMHLFSSQGLAICNFQEIVITFPCKNNTKTIKIFEPSIKVTINLAPVLIIFFNQPLQFKFHRS